MNQIKLNRVRNLSATARYPQTFADRLAAIDSKLIRALSAQQIADIIDGPMQRSYLAGQQAGK